MKSASKESKRQVESQFDIIGDAFQLERIIFVDDDLDMLEHDLGAGSIAATRAFEHARNDATAMQVIRELPLENHGLNVFTIDGELEPPNTLADEIAAHWDGVPRSVRQSFFEAVGMPDTRESTSRAIEGLSDMNMGSVKIEPRSVAEWAQIKEPLFEQNVGGHSGRTLILFDLNLKNADLSTWGDVAYDIAGYYLVQEVLERGNDSLIPGILTNEALDNSGEIALADKQFDNGILAGVMRKNRINPEKPLDFVKGIEMLLSANVLFEVKAAVTKAFDSVPDANDLIASYTNMGVLLHMAAAAESDGAHLSSSLGRMLSTHHEEEAEFAIRKTCSSLPKAKALRAFSKKPFCKALLPETTEIDAFPVKHKAAYIPGEKLAECQSPTSIGDVYELPSQQDDESSFWILLQQPCNTMVRPNGSRTKPEGKFTLVKIIPRQGRLDSSRHSTDIPCPHANHENAEKSFVVDFHAAMYVSPSILDLCVFSTDGQSRSFEPGSNALTFLETGWEIYRNNLADNIKERSERFERIHNSIRRSGSSLNDEVASILLAGVFDLPVDIWPVSYDTTTHSLDFGIRRIARLRTLYSEKLLAEYARYLSRAAYPSKYIHEEEKR